MKKSNFIVPILISCGAVLIFISVWAPQQNFQFLFKQKKFAVVSEFSGNVALVNSELGSQSAVNKNQQLKIRDVIKTSVDSEVVIEFPNSSQFRMLENSEVLIDQMENENPMVVIRGGDLYVEKFGRSPSFWVRKDGMLYSAVDFALIDKKNSSHLLEPIPQNSDTGNKTQLSQIEVETVLNSKKSDFFKCYGQLIQKNPQASGQVLISFNIDTSGKTSKIEIPKTEISEGTFRSCLIEVVARTQFRNFSGNPVSTVFPLKFE